MKIRIDSEKYKLFEENRLLGLKEIDTDEVIIPASCESIHFVQPYYARDIIYLKVKINKRYSLYDLSGKRISGEFKFLGDYSGGIVPFTNNNGWGFLNSLGKAFIYPAYSRVERLTYGKFKVKLNQKWGIVSEQGIEINPTFEDIINSHGKILGRIDGEYKEIKF